MENDINDIDELIGKVLSGEATGEERTRLDACTSANPENEKYLRQVRQIFERSATVVAPDFDADAAWSRMTLRMKDLQRREEKSVQWPTLRLAAAVLLLAAAGIFAYKQLNPPTQTFALVSQKIVLSDTLPDGSRAVLNKASSIEYEYNPGKKVRRVKLRGESFFEVSHQEEKPFIIEAEEVMIRDIGTAFNVKAWPGSDTIEVAVTSGEVRFYTLLDSGINLHAGETGVYTRHDKVFSKIEMVDVNTLSYQTGELNFINAELRSVVRRINEVYDAHLRLENPALESCRLTVSFHHDTLDTVVEVIAETMKLSITRTDREIILDGKGCN